MVSYPLSPESDGSAGVIRQPAGSAPPPALPGASATDTPASLPTAALGRATSSQRSVERSSVGRPSAATAPPPLPASSATRSGTHQKIGAAEVAALEQDRSVLTTFLSQVPSWLVSTVFHLCCILLLAVYTVADNPHWHSTGVAALTRGDGDGDGGLDDYSLPGPEESASAAPGEKLADVLQPTTGEALSTRPLDSSSLLLPSMPNIDSPLGALPGPGLPGNAAGASGGGGAGLAGLGDSIANSLQGRLSATNRARMVGLGGGTLESEDAVAKALKWLSEHQNTDGSWTFDHRSSPRCAGRCGPSRRATPGASRLDRHCGTVALFGSGRNSSRRALQEKRRHGSALSR